ncbi:MAG: ECF transporter S component [Alkalibacterium sp.]|nr:ECF transporter S component [Alkalibacterium sp.]
MSSNPHKHTRAQIKHKTRTLTRIALLTALVSVGRLSFSFLPNVQPMTVLLLCITLYFGWKVGMLVALLSVVLTNMFLGMGPWTVAQIGGYAVLILLSSLLEDDHDTVPIPLLQLYAAFLGIIYGLVLSLIQAPLFGWSIFIPYYLAGLSFDLLHAFGNFAFLPLLYPVCMRVFQLTDKKSG